MKRLPIAALVAFALTPAWGTTSSSHRHKATTHRVSKTSGPHAGLRTAKYSPADTPQTSSSTNHSAASTRKKSAKKKRTTAHRQQMAPTPERVNDIQSALARSGYYKGDATGKFDPDTVDALQRFQSANGLDTTGKLDALTLQKLGLGSDIAGVSSPKGIVPHSCCSMTPSPSLAPRQSTASHPGPSASSTPAEPKASGSLDAGTAPAALADPAPGTSSH